MRVVACYFDKVEQNQVKQKLKVIGIDKDRNISKDRMFTLAGPELTMLNNQSFDRNNS